MKVVKKIVLVIFILSLMFLIYTCITLLRIKTTNYMVENKIKTLKKETEKINNSSTEYDNEIKKLKEEKKEKWEELEIWQKAETKLTKALESS